MSELREDVLAYPKARMMEQVDDYFGTKVADPYRWMEDVDSPELAEWVEAENRLTQEYLAQVPSRKAMHGRLMELMDFERYTVPSGYRLQDGGTRYFYQHNSGLQNQAVVYWQDGLEGERQVLLDPNGMSEDGTVALNGFSVTDDGRLAAYALSEAGSDWLVWRVREVETGKDLVDRIEWSKFSGASWLKDGSGFFYARYDAPGAESFKEANYFHKIYLHKLGTEQSEDALVFERPDNGELNLGAVVTDDGRYLLIHQSEGTSPNNELAVKDLSDPEAPVLRLIAEADAAYSPIENDGTFFWVQTTLDAPNGKVIGIDLTKPEREHWVTLVPESRNAIDQVSMVNDTLIVLYLEDAQSMVELHRRDGTAIGRFSLPGIGTAGGFGGRRTDGETFFGFTNFTAPGVVYRLDMRTMETTVFRQPELRFAPDAFETKQVFVASKDGTRVPVFLSYKKGLVLDGSAPTLLYGYGGFGVSLLPSFSSARVLWMELGGVYAQACLRGGGEYGESWHEAGMKLQKQNVFDDFLACAEWLIDAKYTSATKLAIQGGSNGGLLVGACITQRPELFGAALAEVGVLDMLRFDKFTIGWAWKAEYGSPSEDAAEFAAMYEYSPLHRLRAGVAYPATMVMTADHDDRVFPAHSFKFTAAMQAVAPPQPALIRVETRAGHGAGMPLSKRVEGVVDQYAFLVRALEMAV
ncbi:prolyl oligopeptidase family serine peptidase [Granulicella arctica]|uniref:prolyl oligopeptidase n=1 Tax=Granulicella arctica TaxID=940613 RepID=A0A7Y9PGW2_9BACT|nr:prolyl oligopeptidase family serine peptidase [Granulicella arctica]NYF78903.1 prolyl oligopeptidase [Granulicella arctica]